MTMNNRTKAILKAQNVTKEINNIVHSDDAVEISSSFRHSSFCFV